MKTKLKIIIPIVIAVIAIILAAIFIRFEPNEAKDLTSMVKVAQNYLIEHNYEQAIAEFEAVINLDPRNVEAYIGIAEAYVNLGDTEKAVEWLEKGYEATEEERIRVKLEKLSNGIVGTEVVTAIITEATTEEVITESKMTTVPNLVGLTKGEAQKVLIESNLQIEFVEEYDDSIEKGRIISQSIVANSAVEKDSIVVLIVSKGKEVYSRVKYYYATNFEKGADSEYVFSYNDNDELIYVEVNGVKSDEVVHQKKITIEYDNQYKDITIKCIYDDGDEVEKKFEYIDSVLYGDENTRPTEAPFNPGLNYLSEYDNAKCTNSISDENENIISEEWEYESEYTGTTYCTIERTYDEFKNILTYQSINKFFYEQNSISMYTDLKYEYEHYEKKDNSDSINYLNNLIIAYITDRW